MTARDKDFAAKARSIVSGATKPRSLEDFLEDDRKDGNPANRTDTDKTEIRTSDVRKSVDTDNMITGRKTAREEFRFDPDLAERLRRYAFETRRKKTTIVREALEAYLKARGF